MATIEKKTWPKFFKKVLSGEKTFELRLADFKCVPGDILVLREYDPAAKRYTGRSVRKRVSYVAKTKGQKFWPQEDADKSGFQVIGFK
jgi:hypothetical protein